MVELTEEQEAAVGARIAAETKAHKAREPFVNVMVWLFILVMLVLSLNGLSGGYRTMEATGQMDERD